MDLSRFRKFTEGLTSVKSQNPPVGNENNILNLADTLSEVMPCFENEIFLQYGLDKDQAFKIALIRHPDSYGVIVNEGGSTSLTEDEPLKSRLIFCSDHLSICLEELFGDDKNYRVGSVFIHDPSDYRHLLLLFATIKKYLSDKALILIDHCNWGSIQQATVDLMLLYPCLHHSIHFPTLSHGVQIYYWDLSIQELTDQDLNYIQSLPKDLISCAEKKEIQFSVPKDLEKADPTIRFSPRRYVQLKDFLSHDLNQKILTHGQMNEPNFISAMSYASTSSKGRRSARLSETFFSGFVEIFKHKINDIAPDVLQELRGKHCDIQFFETEMIASYDGCFFAAHCDNTRPETQRRQISCVYYFHKEPRPYQGGSLRLYDTELLGQTPIKINGNFEDIDPVNNSIVFFPSSCLHEILPVFIRSGDFADSRFTINTWIGF